MSPLKRKHDEVEDSEEDTPSYGKQILPVANLPDDFNEEPMDGLQYLFTVRRAARHLPDVVRASNPYEMPEIPIVVENSDSGNFSSASHLPSEEWRKLFELRFHNFKKNFNQPTIHVGPSNQGSRRLMPEKKDRDMWWAFLSGKPESEWNSSKKSKGILRKQYQPDSQGMRGWTDEPRPNQNSRSAYDSWHNNDEGEVEQVLMVDPAETLPSPVGTPVPLEYLEDLSQPCTSFISPAPRVDRMDDLKPRDPTTKLLKLIDERMALHLLMYFTHWMQLHLQSPEVGTHLPTESHARWIFTLLSRVDDYISADDMNLLRNLARACLGILNEIKRKQQPSISHSITPGEIGETSCWLIITIIAETWKQRDLWMDAEDMLAKASL